MRKRLLSLAAAAALFVIGGQAQDARAAAAKVPMIKSDATLVVDVRGHRHYRGGRSFHRNRSFHRPRHVSRHRYHRPRYVHRHYHHRRWHRGPRFGFYIGPSYRGCSWLRHRAVVTGSSYWWRRYRACRAGW